MQRYATLTLLLAVPLAPLAGTAHHRGVHVLSLAQATDTEAAFAAWVGAINADCSDTVVGDLGDNVVRLRRNPEYRIRATCVAPAARSVEIRGHGADSSLIVVNSTAYAGGGGFAFLVDDRRVRIHDLAIRGNASDFARNAGDGNSGEAIRFQGDSGGYGEADHLSISQFATAGVNVYKAPAVSVHDVTVVCPTWTHAPAVVPAMGIWVRLIRQPRPRGQFNGTVDRNTVSTCSAEGIAISSATHIAIRYNRVGCPDGSCASTSIGIALYGDGSDCTRAVVSSNYVYGNTVIAGNSISAGIVIQGTGNSVGSGHANTIDSNTVRDPGKYGIVIARASCVGAAAYGGNVVSRNTLSGAARPLIVVGGSADTVALNTLAIGGGNRTNLIQDLTGTAVVRENIIH